MNICSECSTSGIEYKQELIRPKKQTMKKIITQLINEWKWLITKRKLNWITFTFFNLEIERENRFNQFSMVIIILGLGIRITIDCGESEELEMLIEDYKKSSLNNKNNKK